MLKILIDVLPAMGHFNSVIKLAKMLQEAGHEVLFFDNGLKAEMAKYSFDSIGIGFTFKPIVLKRSDINFINFLRQIRIKKKEVNFNNLLALVDNYKKYLRGIAPDLVILDEQNMLKALYYEICNIPVICFESKPEPYRTRNVPPFTSYYVPSDTLTSKLFCRWLWLIKTIRNIFRLKMIQLTTGGNDNFSISCRIAKHHGIDLRKRINLVRGYGIGINRIPRLIVSAADFDFPHPNITDTFSIGPLLDIDREQVIASPRYKVARNKILQHRRYKEGVVIYCSLGSNSLHFHKKALRFFKRMKEVCILNPKDLFILSVGDDFSVTELYPAPENMYVFDYLPQVDLLRHCDIMVTHGGINSITECVFFEVPTLNYPLSMDWDQPGCAARAVYHKIGQMGKIHKDNAKTISRKLNHIKTDYNIYKSNLQAMKKRFDEKNNSDQVIGIIEGIINQYYKPNENN